MVLLLPLKYRCVKHRHHFKSLNGPSLLHAWTLGSPTCKDPISGLLESSSERSFIVRIWNTPQLLLDGKLSKQFRLTVWHLYDVLYNITSYVPLKNFHIHVSDNRDGHRHQDKIGRDRWTWLKSNTSTTTCTCIDAAIKRCADNKQRNHSEL